MSDEEREYPPNWEGVSKDAKPGTTLTGKLKDARFAKSDFGEFVVVDVETDGGAVVSVPAFHTVLRNQLDEAEPALGSQIVIEFCGYETSGSGRQYRNYRVNGGGSGGGVKRPAWAMSGASSTAPPIEAPSLAETVAQSKSTAADDDDDDSLPF